jgi:hypothetical protein
MKVQIEGQLFLESDGTQFILKEYTGNLYEDKKTGKVTESFKTHGYFYSVQSAIIQLKRMKVMESTATDLKSLLESLKDIRRYIEEKVGV